MKTSLKAQCSLHLQTILPEMTSPGVSKNCFFSAWHNLHCLHTAREWWCHMGLLKGSCNFRCHRRGGCTSCFECQINLITGISDHSLSFIAYNRKMKSSSQRSYWVIVFSKEINNETQKLHQVNLSICPTTNKATQLNRQNLNVNIDDDAER